MLEGARARRSAPNTLAEAGPRPGTDGGCRCAANKTPCSACCGARILTGLAHLGVIAAELSGWRKAFLAGGEASLKCRPADARDDETGRLKEKVGDLTMANELLGGKIERLETSRPLARRRSRR